MQVLLLAAALSVAAASPFQDVNVGSGLEVRRPVRSLLNAPERTPIPPEARLLKETATPSLLHFGVHCKKTKPGKGVFVVGSIPELGNWDVTKAFELHTNTARFPRWSATLSSISAGTIFYSFVVQSESRDGEAKWETLSKDRVIEVLEGSAVMIEARWGEDQQVVETWMDGKIVPVGPQSSNRPALAGVGEVDATPARGRDSKAPARGQVSEGDDAPVAVPEKKKVKMAAFYTPPARDFQVPSLLHFELECDEVYEGETVFVVGSVSELGEWDMSKALEMHTTEERFPRWTATVPSLRAATAFYTFVIQNEDRSGKGIWEKISGVFKDRRVEIHSGTAVTVATRWGDENQEVESWTKSGVDDAIIPSLIHV